MDKFRDLMAKLVKNLPAIKEASVLFSEEIVNKLEVLADMDISVIAKDLNKGNYLGNRKLDINITLNNDNVSEEVTYKSATLTLNNGIVIPINFETLNEGGDRIVEEIASYTGLYTKILKGITAYNKNEVNPQKHVVNFEIDVVNQTIAKLPTLLRIRDTDGSACNIDRVTLAAYSGGSPKEQNPSYFWAKTTSSLEVLGNRIGDMIALGGNIAKIIALSDKEDEIQVLYDLRDILQLLRDEILNIKAIGENIAHVIGANENKININGVNKNKTNIDLLASKINDNTIANAITAADTAIQKAQQTQDDAIATASDRNAVSGMKDETLVLKNETQSIRESIQAIAVEGNTLAEGQKVQIAYNSAENKFIFSIPKGDKGARGEAFKVNAMGLIAQKSSYDTQLKDFSFFATDTGEIYFKNTNVSADWSVPIPFGKGERGKTGATGNGISSVIRVSGNGSAGTNDTYRITFTNGSTYEYNVYNGSQSDIKMADLSFHINDSSNPHSVTKAQIALGNVDNTSDKTKPISTATQTALNAKTTDLTVHKNNNANPHTVTKAQIGLSNVNNTSDKEKPISTATQTALNRKASIDDLSSAVPSGVITMWSGLISAVPSGWHLCNGSNGTPDLRGRFVYGATVDADVKDVGGNKDAVAIAHTHSGSTDVTGAHTHALKRGKEDGGGTGLYDWHANIGSIGTSSSGNHSHIVTINNSGVSGTDKNLPPYMKLAYIMKG